MSQAQQMFNFCPHCGKGINQDQQPGQKVFCRYCGKDIGTTPSVIGASISAGTVVTKGKVVDRRDEPIQQGKASRCRFCNQVVETRGTGEERKFVPHYDPALGKKICKSSGRRISD
jgi:DNA-directed RNA polymerase subunit RPC12/RpoP